MRTLISLSAVILLSACIAEEGARLTPQTQGGEIENGSDTEPETDSGDSSDSSDSSGSSDSGDTSPNTLPTSHATR